MGIVGDFDVSNFDLANNKAIAFIVCISYLVLMSLVMLNALIAILGDSYEKTQMEAEG